MSGFRVGMRNPWALAELKTQVPIDWGRVATPTALLAKILEIPEGDLFSPERSPLFPRNEERAPPWLREFIKSVPVWADKGAADTHKWHDVHQDGALTDCFAVAPIVALSFVGVMVKHTALQSGRHRFELFSDPQTTKTFEFDERLPFKLSSCLLALGDDGSSEPHVLLPGLIEKALLCLWAGAESDQPSLVPFQQFGTAASVLLHLTGKQATGVKQADIPQFLNTLPPKLSTDGRSKAVIVASIGEDVGTRVSDQNLSGSHAYALLGMVSSNGGQVVIVHNPRSRRDTTATDLTWDVLEKFDWLKPHSANAKGNASGVIPVPRTLFEEIFAWIDVV
jgi:hypothetical protein